MESLSNEVLVSIASYLPTTELRALSLISKHFLFISQERLYRAPSIPASLSPSPQVSKAAALLRALIKHPGLAKLVRHLEVQPQRSYEVFDHATILPDQSAAAMQVLECIQPRISQYAILAMILERTENL
jgi:hypothetical protein